MKIKLVTPILNSMEPETMQCVLDMIRTSEHKIDWRLKIGDGLISRVRNIIGQEALESDCDYLLMVDDDIVWKSKENPVDKLISYGKDIACGLYVTRALDHHPVLRSFDTQEDLIAKKKNPKRTEIEYGLMEVVYTGTGFMLIKKDCLKKIYDNYKYPFMPMENETGEYLSEDYAFCHRARELDYKIYVDTTLELGHIGKQIFSIKDYNPDYVPKTRTIIQSK